MTTCPNCRTSVSHNNTIGCCTACGRCFSGLSAFEAHQVGPRDQRGRLTCLDGEPSVWRQWSDPAKAAAWVDKARAS